MMLNEKYISEMKSDWFTHVNAAHCIYQKRSHSFSYAELSHRRSERGAAVYTPTAMHQAAETRMKMWYNISFPDE